MNSSVCLAMNGWLLTWTSERSVWISKPDGKSSASGAAQLAAYISSQRDHMIRTVTPASGGVLIEFDIRHSEVDSAYSAAAAMIDSYEQSRTALAEVHTFIGRDIAIPVCYDERLALDLYQVANQLCCHPEHIIERHSRATYRVEAVGFIPGFGYLGPLDAFLRLPRRDRPRTQVPSGSVAIVENMTAVYPHSSAGGWYLIGRTHEQLFDPARREPAVLRVGDVVRFEQITYDEYMDCRNTLAKTNRK